jgi:hypothetical protein
MHEKNVIDSDFILYIMISVFLVISIQKIDPHMDPEEWALSYKVRNCILGVCISSVFGILLSYAVMPLGFWISGRKPWFYVINYTDTILDSLLENSGLISEARYFLIIVSYIPLTVMLCVFVRDYGFGDMLQSYWELIGGLFNGTIYAVSIWVRFEIFPSIDAGNGTPKPETFIIKI